MKVQFKETGFSYFYGIEFKMSKKFAYKIHEWNF